MNSLRLSRLAAASDEPQIAGLRDSHLRAVEGARGVVHDLIGLWKRQCAAALALLADRRQADLAGKARALLDARDRLVAAIDGLTAADARRM